MEITAPGSLLIVEEDGRTHTYQKKNISFEMNAHIVIRNLGKTVGYIRDHESVANIDSLSMSDLFDKLLLLIS